MSTNSSQPDTRFNRWDALVAAAVALLAVISAAAFYLPTLRESGALTVVIECGGREMTRTALSELTELSFQHAQGDTVYDYVIVGDGESVWVESSTCPTQDCVHTGRIARAGQSIVCLPAQVVIHLEGTAQSGGPDVIVG